jgi:pyruvate dehydrogenase E2 component (dihydrolipoamide acetyltransferase)
VTQKASSKPEEQTKSDKKSVLATPAIRKMAQEMGIELSEVEGSGPKGRIVAEDVQRYLGDRKAPQPDAAPETIPYRGLRRKIGTHLAKSKQVAAHYTYVEEADVTELVILRQKLLDQKGSEDRPTYLPFIMKAVLSGLKQYPLLNAELVEEKQEIQLKKEYHFGVAIATPDGLVVPVVKNVDEKNILDLAREVSHLAELSRAGKLQVENLQGGTFTITSLGALGGLMATPIINHPEVAILGVHKVRKQPVVENDEIVIRDLMNLSISLDHRVVDGAVAAEFMHHVISLLQEPGLLLLEGD